MSRAISKFILAASMVLAMAFTFSCSSDSDSSGEIPYSSLNEPSSSSSEIVVSSSSIEWSSSSVLSSSSIVVPSSSSILIPSSSSFEPPSSSSVTQSSSSEMFSSSSSSSSSSSVGYAGSYGSVYYEGQNYKTVVIGTQTWMAENLNYSPSTGNSACYNNEPSNCAIYGRLYDWSTAMNIDKSYNSSSWSSWGGSDVKHRGICPSGWHIPNYDEWVVLRDYVGGYLTAGRYLKATSRWNSSFLCEVSCNGTDEYGFSALPGGHYSNNTNRFASVGDYGIYWSASENNSYGNRAYILEIRALENVGLGASNENKPDLNSVRCIQD